MQGPAETLTFGFEDYLYGEGACLIEWAERVLSILPSERLWITLRHLDETKRGILMTANGERYLRLLQEFKGRTFGV